MNDSKSYITYNCGCGIAILVINLFIGAWSVQYLVAELLGKTITFGWAMVIGLFGGELTIPAAIITWLLKQAGVL